MRQLAYRRRAVTGPCSRRRFLALFTAGKFDPEHILDISSVSSPSAPAEIVPWSVTPNTSQGGAAGQRAVERGREAAQLSVSTAHSVPTNAPAPDDMNCWAQPSTFVYVGAPQAQELRAVSSGASTATAVSRVRSLGVCSG